jgi:DNA-binding LacI/PurR family transcriptional regulator
VLCHSEALREEESVNRLCKTINMATIRDVARQAGVSPATVSRWMNGRLVVKPSTAERISAAVKQLRYVPSLVARTLVTKESRTIGLLLADISNPFFAALARAVEDAAQERGYAVIVCNSDSNPEKEAGYIRLLNRKYIDGILFLSNSPGGSGLKAALKEEIPIVVVDEAIEGVKAPGVFTDNVQGAYDAVTHLIHLGHRRIGHVTGPPVYSTPLRLHGYRRALEDNGLPFDSALVRVADFQTEGGRRAARMLLNLPQRPTAIFAGNDLMALGAIQAAWEAGLRVPEDLAIVGFDDIPLASAFVPPLTTVAQPLTDMGRVAVDMLVRRIEGKPARRRVILPCTLRVRQSCGASQIL